MLILLLFLPAVALNSSVRRHQLLAKVPTKASHWAEYSRFSSMEMYSKNREREKERIGVTERRERVGVKERRERVGVKERRERVGVKERRGE